MEGRDEFPIVTSQYVIRYKMMGDGNSPCEGEKCYDVKHGCCDEYFVAQETDCKCKNSRVFSDSFLPIFIAFILSAENDLTNSLDKRFATICQLHQYL